jgi:hypothetical protein
MSKPRASDAHQSSPGDQVALLVGDYDPPHMDYFRAIDALFASGSSVWMCPLFTTRQAAGRARVLATILSVDFMSATRKQPSCCLIGLDKEMRAAGAVLEWCRTYYPLLSFKLASFGNDGNVAIRFAMRTATPPGSEVLFLDKFVPVHAGLRAAIGAGQDESRNFTPGVWSCIQKRKLYR